MTDKEKQKVYDFLKTVSSFYLGYTSPSFLGEIPAFKDDREEEEAFLSSLENKDLTPHTHFFENENQKNENSLLEEREISKKQDKEQEKKNTLSSLAEKVALCSNCILRKKRINAVFGEGCESPYVMVIGEGPGEEEDKSGRPFVGKAGELLDKMLSSIALSRKTNCYIANIVKCRPPMNRTPMPDEASACSGFLQAQIALLKPHFILAVGRTAAQNLLGTTKGLGEIRGQWLEYNLGMQKIPLLATYHPSALLRDESKKRPAWEDLKTFRSRLQKECPKYTENPNGTS